MHPINKWLADNGKTQEQGAAEFGITQAYMSQIVNGARRPSPKLAERISEITGIDFKLLLLPPKSYSARDQKLASSGGTI